LKIDGILNVLERFWAYRMNENFFGLSEGPQRKYPPALGKQINAGMPAIDGQNHYLKAYCIKNT